MAHLPKVFIATVKSKDGEWREKKITVISVLQLGKEGSERWCDLSKFTLKTGKRPCERIESPSPAL